jgi:hypothetical protein
MTKRRRSVADLVCPHCGRSGVAHVSQSTFPYTRDRAFAVEQLTHGFRLVREGASLAEVEIACDRCGIAVTPAERKG